MYRPVPEPYDPDATQRIPPINFDTGRYWPGRPGSPGSFAPTRMDRAAPEPYDPDATQRIPPINFDTGRYWQPAQPGPGSRAGPGAPPAARRAVGVGEASRAAAGGGVAEPSLGRSSRIMAVASAASRLTGFLRSLAIAAAIGLGLVGDAYNTANTLPNIVYELLLGGVLTSVVVPLLVHAQERDADRGEAYTQRLLSLATVTLAAATVLAVLAAPLLTALYVGSDSPKAHLATVFAWLLLPEIFFYGVGAMFGAILNTRGVYGPAAWAPVLNNLVVIGTAAVFILLPGPARLLPNTITGTQVAVLGIGTTLGIVLQAAVLLPALRRAGFRWRWRLGGRDARLGEAGGLALWVLGYVAISQVGYVVITRLANEVTTAGRGYAVFTNASLLFQMPYGILGVSLLTALMPRMSRAAAHGDRTRVVADLSLGSRLTAVTLVPVTVAFVVLGPAIGTVIYAHGQSTAEEARQVGVVLAASAFGLVPFAITMLQLRVFYAVKDARTPTLINVGMVAAKIAIAALIPAVLPDRHVVTGLAVATSASYVVGLLLGEVLLRRRFGRLRSGLVVRTTVRLALLSAFGGLAAWGVLALVTDRLGRGVGGSAVAVLLGSLAGLLVLAALASRWQVAELRELTAALRGRVPVAIPAGAAPAGPRRRSTGGRHRAS